MAMIFSEKNVEVRSLHILLTVFICPFSKGKHPGVKKIAFLITDGLLNVDPSKTIGDFCRCCWRLQNRNQWNRGNSFATL